MKFFATILCFYAFPLLSLDLINQNSPDPQVITQAINELPDNVFKPTINVQHFIKDPEDRINKIFEVPKVFQSSTVFWFNIYTKYPSNNIIFHDSQNLALIYDILDFSKLPSSGFDSFTTKSMQQQMVIEKYNVIQKHLLELSNGSINSNNKFIIGRLKQAKLSIPKKTKDRRIFYRNLSARLRTQTGQKDIIAQGLERSSIYKESIEFLFKEASIPYELEYISFLESSFNPSAISKSFAVGVWQFVPETANSFLPQSKFIDYRLNPIISTIAAIKLLKENKMLLKDWPLAITAYNTGLSQINKAKKSLKLKSITLNDLLFKYKHANVGFAVKNYYSEFLAITHALAYGDKIYDFKYTRPSPVFKIYIMACPLQTSELTKLIDNFKEINPQFVNNQKIIPKFSILTSTENLNHKHLKEISYRLAISKLPKDWYREIKKGYNCSTR